MKIESHFEKIFAKVPIGLGLIDSKAERLVAANTCFCAMFGLKSAEEAPVPYMVPTHPHDLHNALSVKEKMRAGDLQDFSFEKCNVRNDGSSCWFNLTVAPLLNGATEPDCMLVIVEEITARKEAEQHLLETNSLLEQRVAERTAELLKKNRELQEANTALKVLLQKQEEVRKEIGEDLLGSIKIAIEPSLKKLAKICPDKHQKKNIKVIETHLKEVIKPLPRVLSANNLNLSKTETIVADLVKNSLSNKQIAEDLHISVDTVAFHRKNIRRKLGIQDRNTSLAAYLQDLMQG